MAMSVQAQPGAAFPFIHTAIPGRCLLILSGLLSPHRHVRLLYHPCSPCGCLGRGQPRIVRASTFGDCAPCKHAARTPHADSATQTALLLLLSMFCSPVCECVRGMDRVTWQCSGRVIVCVCVYVCVCVRVLIGRYGAAAANSFPDFWTRITHALLSRRYLQPVLAHACDTCAT